MHRYADGEEVDYAIVGTGAGGGVLAQRLARAGFRVVTFDAGPFWDTERDWVSDEKGSHQLYWTNRRVTGGSHPLALGENNSGQGVGGSTVHWASFTPRLHPSDFHIHSLDGVGVDWPLDYADVRPYYELMELELPVSGPAYFPWGDPHGYPYGAHPMGGVGDALIRGCTALGIPVSAGGPVGILEGSRADRPHCIYRGFCIQGCKVGAKASTLITHVPDAIANGAEIRANCMVSRVALGSNRRVNGVFYFGPDGRELFQKAKAVVIAGYSIETPRLLLNSACDGFENGLANSSDTVGRYLMAQAGNVVLGRFDQPVRMYKAPPAHALTEEFYETDPKRDFARGFAIQTVGPLPISFAKQMMSAKGAWGWGLRRLLMDYNHWASFGLLGEILPHAENRVQLADEKDQFGLPVAKVTFNLGDNDKKLIDFGKNKVMEVMHAAGAEEVVQEARYAHLVGAARMGNDPQTSVVDRFGRTHDIANLFICDGSIMPTQGSANPGLTVMSLAARIADYLIIQGNAIFASDKRDMQTSPIRYDLSPPDTWGHGMPRPVNHLVS
ncbi:MAG: GMC family oxidoreductase [Candidatus Eremiobacteraeota bacterium]|nr:GMC family oxidoreductase [Candidatus Eremiobacteraeota bacterium]MBC5801788.1 GMC family oxidoreductase [Candidatus Eremiobacteraeota bacterium]MBC5823146.1 GMC family oxidoreductase [Candidatus Eremiobacteraeota bacterium]